MKSDDCWEEEDIYIVADLSGFIDDAFLQNYGTDHSVLGLETQQPYVQVDHNVFQGKYKQCFGTCLLFEETLENDAESESTATESPSDGVSPELTYYCQSTKILDLKKAFFAKKTSSKSATSSGVNAGPNITSETHTGGEITHAHDVYKENNIRARDITRDESKNITNLHANSDDGWEMDDT